jgi:hypothetical protein
VGDPDAPPLQAKELLALLDRHHVDYVVVGGLAAIAHGSARATFDIDLVPDWSSSNLARLASALREADARLRVPGGQPIEYPIDTDSLRAFEVSTWRTRHGDLDVIAGTPTLERGRLAHYAELAGRAHRREAFGITILVANLSDIIESKQALAREPDLAALPELHRLQDRATREGIDPPALP